MTRALVIVLDLVLGAAAVGCGAYLAAGSWRLGGGRPEGAAVGRLRWSGLFLLVVVGGTLLSAGGLLLTDIRTGRLASAEAGVVLLGWSAVMLSTVGRRRWSHFLPFVLGIAAGMVLVVVSFTLPVPG